MRYLLAAIFTISGVSYLTVGLWEILRMVNFGVLPLGSAIIYALSIILIPLLSLFAAAQSITRSGTVAKPWFYVFLLTLVASVVGNVFAFWMSQNSPIPFLNSPGQFIVYIVLPTAVTIYILTQLPRDETGQKHD